MANARTHTVLRESLRRCELRFTDRHGSGVMIAVYTREQAELLLKRRARQGEVAALVNADGEKVGGTAHFEHWNWWFDPDAFDR